MSTPNDATKKAAANLLAQLDAEAPKFLASAVVIGYENGDGFVLANDPHRNGSLEDALRRGGKAYGLVGVLRDNPNAKGVASKLFPEYANEKRVQQALADAGLAFLMKYSEDPKRTKSYFISTEPLVPKK